MNPLTLIGIISLSQKIEGLADNAENYEQLIRGAFSTAQKVANLWEDVPKQFPDIEQIAGIPADQMLFFKIQLTAKKSDRDALLDLPLDAKKNIAEFIYVFAEKSLELATKLQEIS